MKIVCRVEEIVNSAIGVDLHGNIWADSMKARQIYSGVGGQCDFIRGANLSEGGVPIIALKSKTTKGFYPYDSV